MRRASDAKYAVQHVFKDDNVRKHAAAMNIGRPQLPSAVASKRHDEPPVVARQQRSPQILRPTLQAADTKRVTKKQLPGAADGSNHPQPPSTNVVSRKNFWKISARFRTICAAREMIGYS
jgi:hypothetical protein